MVPEASWGPTTPILLRVSDRDDRYSSAEATTSLIIDAAAALLLEKGAAGLNVSAIMRQAGVSRTTFYRLFDDVSGPVAALLELIVGELFSQAGAWFTDIDAVGSRDVIWDNALRDGRALKPRIELLGAIVDATSQDESLRTLWRDSVRRPWIDATATAIRADQAAGAIRASLDPDATALALTLMGEQVALEVLGRLDGQPEQYAAILTPIWEAVLFGHSDPLT